MRHRSITTMTATAIATTNLDLLEGEATTKSLLGIVALCLGVNDRAEQTIDGAREDASSLLGARDAARLLLARLVEPGLDAERPLLVEVDVGYNVVVLDHCAWKRAR